MSNIIWPGFQHLLNIRCKHLIYEACCIETNTAWCDAIAWMDKEERQKYEKEGPQQQIKAYQQTLQRCVSSGKHYLRLTEEDFIREFTPVFFSQRKLAIHQLAAERTLLFYLSIPPAEYEEKILFEELYAIRMSQLEIQRVAREDYQALTQCVQKTVALRNQDELVRRRVVKRNRWLP